MFPQARWAVVHRAQRQDSITLARVVADSNGSSGVEVAVVIDANAMWNQWLLSGKSWDDLHCLVEQDRIALYVPEVVVQEVVRGRRTDANDLVLDLVKIKLSRIEGLRQLGLATDRKALRKQVQDRVANYDSYLRRRLGELGAVIVPIPSVSHQEILTRALQGRRPFDSEGRNGYRDVLIWHSLLEVVRFGHSRIVFVTNNTKDFCVDNPPELRHELRDELANVSLRAVTTIATSVNEIGVRVDELERRRLPVLERPSDGEVFAALRQCIDVIVAGAEPPTPGRWGEELTDGWQFLSVLEEDPVDVVSIEFDDASLACERDGDDWAKFTVRIRADVTLDGFAFKGDVYAVDRVNVEVQDSDWNDHYMWIHEHHNAELTFRLAFDHNGAKIEECWLEDSRETIGDGDADQELASG